ncbi:hypothetical protein INR49_019611 [Caranx melampygus]|nr:hypothetical protein INR49_019611 [Caranx melampygus]
MRVVTGMFESWVPKLVSALYEREPTANVIVVDWLTRANQHYPTSAAYTKLVGRDVAKFVTWLQKELQLPWGRIHLLGYSLGAHVAGIAGDLTDHKISRITGLDPAGPTFEHADDQNTLSRDDAQFVDVLHTNTRGSPDRSIGIQRPVGHIDIYPNGGTFQPGCDIQNTLMGIALEGIKGLQNMDQLVKCSHERSIHLFIDSLLNTQQQSMAYRCNSKEAFNKGMCLNCRKNRCNKLGYNINKVRTTRSTKMYLKTRDMMPYKVFHYQVKVHFFSEDRLSFTEQPLQVSLYGTHGEKEDISTVLWSNWWGSNKFHIRKMRIKSGETQSKVIFSPKEGEFAYLVRGGEDAVFVKSREDTMSRKEKLMHKLKMQGTVQYVTSLEEELADSIFGNILEPLSDLFDHKDDRNQTFAKFSLRKPSDPDDDLCYIVPGKPDSLATCNFNSTSKTFLVIHGWTLSGMFEGWVAKLVSALYEREQTANVIVVDWLTSAQNHYVVAAQNTKAVGYEVARFIDWIEETTNMPLENLHLIGYSLGAHVAGFAGSHATNKVGRITGLDPAGPDFEGEHAHRRLSPDDAHFVDVLHTFTRGSLGLSIGIQQPVGHVDIYPNGGSFQPGCNLRGALEKIANFGLFAITDAIKCEHERSVHLFIDSLLNEQEAAKAYRCGSNDMFNRGMCLSCRKGRCNTVGYNISKVRKSRNVQMYTKTRASMPFRVYHYQLKMHFSSKVNRSEMEPSITVSLFGTKGEADNLDLKLKEKIATNRTHSFLLVTEEDIGDLLMLTFKWEETNGWSASNMLKMVSSWWSGDSDGANMEVHKIRIRAGETQQKMVFCVKDPDVHNLKQEVTFVKCKDSWRTNRKQTQKRVTLENH